MFLFSLHVLIFQDQFLVQEVIHRYYHEYLYLENEAGAFVNPYPLN